MTEILWVGSGLIAAFLYLKWIKSEGGVIDEFHIILAIAITLFGFIGLAVFLANMPLKWIAKQLNKIL